MIRFEAAATLRCWAIDVDLGDAVYTIPAAPASTWLLVCSEGGWGDIVPGMLTADEADTIDNLMTDGQLDPGDVTAAARDALTAAAGVKWWVARTLAHLGSQSWVGPELLLRGVDPATVPLGAYLAAAYHVITRGLAPEKRVQFDWDLQRPPAEVPPEEWFDEEEAAEGFYAAMASMNG